MIGDVIGGMLIGVGICAIIWTFVLGMVIRHLTALVSAIERIEKKLSMTEDPDYDAWDDEWRITDAERGWMPDRIDTRDDD